MPVTCDLKVRDFLVPSSFSCSRICQLVSVMGHTVCVSHYFFSLSLPYSSLHSTHKHTCICIIYFAAALVIFCLEGRVLRMEKEINALGMQNGKNYL